MTDFRALCAELVKQLEGWQCYASEDGPNAKVLDRARAALSQPKPPSLKKQALQALSEAVKMADDFPPEGICSDQADIIRRALEALPND
jgi:hypothetical protein